MENSSFRLSKLILTRAKASPVGLVRDLDIILRNAGELSAVLDRKFRYRQISAELLARKASQLQSVAELNRLYWRDTGSTIKAYTLSSTWRLLELVKHTCALTNESHSVLGPAILARSLIELATVFILTGSAVRKAVSGAAEAWTVKVALSEELEQMLAKALHGTRLVPEKDFYRQINILTHIQRLSKISGFEDVLKIYERLCEVAHPNALGNARFWADGGISQEDGSILWSGGPQVVNEATKQIQDDTLWSLAFTASNAVAGFEILDQQVLAIAKAFP